MSPGTQETDLRGAVESRVRELYGERSKLRTSDDGSAWWIDGKPGTVVAARSLRALATSMGVGIARRELFVRSSAVGRFLRCASSTVRYLVVTRGLPGHPVVGNFKRQQWRFLMSEVKAWQSKTGWTSRRPVRRSPTKANNGAVPVVTSKKSEAISRRMSGLGVVPDAEQVRVARMVVLRESGKPWSPTIEQVLEHAMMLGLKELERRK